MLLPDPTSSWLFKPINSRILSKDAMLDEHPSLCELWPKLFFSLTEELSPKACQSHTLAVVVIDNLLSELAAHLVLCPLLYTQNRVGQCKPINFLGLLQRKAPSLARSPTRLPSGEA